MSMVSRVSDAVSRRRQRQLTRKAARIYRTYLADPFDIIKRVIESTPVKACE